MARTAPLRRSEALIGELAEMATQHVIDELRLARVRRDAERLMDNDPAGAHAALGCIAALKGDVASVEDHHRIARQLNPSHPYNNYNHAVSLRILEESDRALQVAIDGLVDTPDDLDLLALGIDVAVKSGQVGEACTLLEHWQRVVPDQPHERADVVSLLSDAIAAGDFSEASLQEVTETMTAIQRGSCVGSTVGWSMWWNYVDESFVYSRLVHATPHRAAELNEALADELAERAELMDDLGTKFVALFTGRGS